MSTTPTANPPAGPLTNLLCRLGGMNLTMVDDLAASRSYFINTACAMIGLGLLATASFSYALVSTNIVDDWRIAVTAGLGWAVLMVTIERLLIISMKRDSRGPWRNLFQAFAGFGVRLTVAAIIGAVVSTPLVLKIFEPAIAAQVQADIVEIRTAATAKLDADFADIPVMEQRVAELNQQIETLPFYDPAEVNPAYAAAKADRDAAKKACDKANKNAADEAAGRSGTGHRGYGGEWDRLSGIAKKKCAAYAKAESTFNQISTATQDQYEQTAATTRATAEAERDRLNEELTQRRADRDVQAQALYGSINGSDGLAARMRALEHLTTSNSAIAAGHLFLMLALMMVEVMPVFAKFLKTIGPADAYSQIEVKREEARVTEEEIYEVDRELATKARSAIQIDSARDWVTKQLVVEREINTKAVAVTKEIELDRLDLWKQSEQAKHRSEIARAKAKLRKALAETPPGTGPNHLPPQQALGLNTP